MRSLLLFSDANPANSSIAAFALVCSAAAEWNIHLLSLNTKVLLSQFEVPSTVEDLTP